MFMPVVYDKNLKQTARVLRWNMTEAERLLWSKIRGKNIRGVQWYRQKPIVHYIVDFYCPRANLVIEVDGDQHYEEDMKIQDKERDNALNTLGLRVLRFGNKDIFQNMEGVLMKIEQVMINPCN